RCSSSSDWVRLARGRAARRCCPRRCASPSGASSPWRFRRASDCCFTCRYKYGEWSIEDEIFPVAAHNVVIVPKGTRFYYRGNFKQVCVTAPAKPNTKSTSRDVEL